MNDLQTSDELTTKIITFVVENTHRRKYKWNNSFELRRIVRSSTVFTQSKLSDGAHEWSTDCRWIAEKIITFASEAAHRRNHKGSNSSESRRILWKCSFLHSQSSLTVLMNDPQTANELPTKHISLVGEAEHRRNHKWSNSFESCITVRKCSFLTQSKYSDDAHEWFTDCRRITDKNYFISGRVWT